METVNEKPKSFSRAVVDGYRRDGRKPTDSFQTLKLFTTSTLLSITRVESRLVAFESRRGRSRSASRNVGRGSRWTRVSVGGRDSDKIIAASGRESGQPIHAKREAGEFPRGKPRPPRASGI